MITYISIYKKKVYIYIKYKLYIVNYMLYAFDNSPSPCGTARD